MRWTVRDLLWCAVVISLLLTLAILVERSRRDSHRELELPGGDDGVVNFYIVDASDDHTAAIVQVGSEVALSAEIHENGDLSNELSEESLVGLIRLDPGAYCITWRKEELNESATLQLLCNGESLRTSVPRSNVSTRESAVSAGPASLHPGESYSPMSIVEGRDGENEALVKLVLRCNKLGVK